MISAMTDWLDRLGHWWMEGDPVELTDARRQRYRTLHRIASEINPWRVVEIGVRAGYSAYAMLSAVPDAWYLGIDNDAGEHGGLPGALNHARDVLSDFARAAIVTADSHDIDRLPTNIGLLHIDGDHSYSGCLQDLRLGDRSEVGHILVDDVGYIEEVRSAVHRYVEETGHSVQWIEDGHHGAALINVST